MSKFSGMVVLEMLVLLWLVQLAEPQASSIPGDEVIATLGKPLLLHCYLGKPLNPNLIRVYWQGRMPSDSADKFPMVLHAYNKGEEEFDQQSSRYRNRTEISRNLIHQGNLSLLIREVRAEDDNTQLIVHIQENVFRNICRKTLRVTASFQKPEVHVLCTERTGLLEIVCKSHGGFPEPQMNWTGLNQLDNKPSPTVTVSPNNSTYTISSALWVNLTKDQRVTCYVTNPTLQETVSTSTTASTSCPGLYLPDHTTTVTILVVLGIVTLTGCVVGILLYKRNRSCRKARAPTSQGLDEEKSLQEMQDHPCPDT